MTEEINETEDTQEVDETETYEKQRCPQCNSLNFIHAEGCDICINCGWSACELN